MKQSSPLFRREVLEARVDRLHGDVSMAVPLSWQVIGCSLFVALLAAGVFLVWGNFARVETVSGTLTPDAGVAIVVPPRPGVVTRVMVREGARVRTGAPLITLDAGETLADGSRSSDRMREALALQDQQLAEQGSAIIRAAEAERAQLREQIAGLRAAVRDIDDQLVDQARLVEVSASEFRDAGTVAERGFLSRRDLAAREATLLQRRQQLSQLRQARAEKQAALAAAERAIVQSLANGQAQAAGAGSNRTALAQQLAQVNHADGFTLVSPIDGIATAVTARAGQAAVTQQPLLMIVPTTAKLRAELSVPTSAAGFLSRGQEVRLSIDAFPFQRFGTVAARIAEVAAAASVERGTDGRSSPAFLVVLDIPKPWVNAFGRQQRLLPGMTLSARIVTRRQSLLEWLFEPVFAVSAR